MNTATKTKELHSVGFPGIAVPMDIPVQYVEILFYRFLPNHHDILQQEHYGLGMMLPIHTLLNIHYNHAQENSFAIHNSDSNASIIHFGHYETNQIQHLSIAYLFFVPMTFLFHYHPYNTGEHKANPATCKMFLPGHLHYLFYQMVLLFPFLHSTNVATHHENDLRSLKNERSFPCVALLL